MDRVQEKWESGFWLRVNPKPFEIVNLTNDKLLRLVCDGELSKTSFKTPEEDDRMVELFMKVQEKPENIEREIDKLGGNVERFGVELGRFSKNTMQMYEIQRTMLSNYLHNVEGEIYKAHYYGDNGEYGQTLYVAVPADAPLVTESINYFMDCFSTMVNEYKKIMQRYKLRHMLEEKLPSRKIEADYFEQYKEKDDEMSETGQTIYLVLLMLDLLLLWYAVFRY